MYRNLKRCLMTSSLFCICLLISANQIEAQSDNHEFAKQLSSSFRSAAEKVLPAVVSIKAENEVEPETTMENIPEMFKQFLPEDLFRRGEMPTPQWQGSGVIISKDGKVLTNNHVVKDADKIDVTLDDGRRLEAEVIATDPETDIALIQIDADTDFPFASLGDSDEMQVGDWVLAIGNPFGLSQSVSEGIVSAIGRTSEDVPVGSREAFFIKNYIQTTAAINPGNSGGPLINLDGEVIAINNAIQTAGFVAGNVGIGFAIPSNLAQRVVDDLIEFGRVRRGYIGVFLRTIDENVQQYYKEEYDINIDNGAQVQDVFPDTPGEKAGLKPGDIIIEFNGEKVKDSGTLVNMVTDQAVGSTVDLVILRGGERKEIEMTLAERPKPEERAQMQELSPQIESSLSLMMLGINVDTLNAQLAEEYGYEEDMSGVVITEVKPGSSAARHDLQVGDVISELNDKSVGSKEEFEKILSDVRKKMKEDEINERALLLYVHRAGSDFYPVFVAPTVKLNTDE